MNGSQMIMKRSISALAAFFMGITLTATTAIVCGTFIVMFTLKVAERKVDKVLGLAGSAVENLPAMLESLPPALRDVFNDERDPGYTKNIETSVTFVPAESGEGLRPVLSVTNRGDRTVTLLGVHVVALDANKAPRREWSEVVATPLAIENEWRGVLMPGATRHVILGNWRSAPSGLSPQQVTASCEISELRVWKGTNVVTTSALNH
ncbi:MAG: hypothetical protein AABZ47_05245 [Planctomycetota bacterium]